MIPFTKMQSLGNDFVVINATQPIPSLNPAIIKKMADRRYGIGFDQLLLLEPSESEQANYRYRIFNADGSEAEQCGNGARCMARFIHEQQLSSQRAITLQTSNALIELTLQDNGDVKVNMGAPQTIHSDNTLNVDQQTIHYHFVSIGNPHAVILGNQLNPQPALAKAISEHPQFPLGVNVGFAQILDRQHIQLRVYERGCGFTPACGSGACAAAIALIQQQLVEPNVTISQPGGDIQVSWMGEQSAVYMTGPSETVFQGQWPYHSTIALQ